MNKIPINDNSSEPANTNGELAILARTRLYGACGTVETLTNLGKAFEFINEINIMLAAGCEHNFEFVAEGMNYVMEHLCALQDAATQLVEIETIKAICTPTYALPDITSKGSGTHSRSTRSKPK
jgi:hypothetical protein